MVTPPEIEAQILRYYHAEKWRIGTIARQLHVHHSVVRRVLAQAGLPRDRRRRRGRRRSIRTCRSSAQTLEKFPTLTASRLYAMVRERGYRGSPDHFRHLIACITGHAAGRGLSAAAHACRASRRRSTGRISAICRSAGRAGR